MNMRIILLLLIFPLLVIAQTPKIGLSKNGTKLLVFPNEIDFSVLGDPYNFVEVPFSQSNSKYGKLIVGIQFSNSSNDLGAKTNYSVVTKDGTVYDFLLYLDPDATNASMKVNKSLSALSINGKGNGKTKALEQIIKENDTETDSILPKEHYYKTYDKAMLPTQESLEAEKELPLTQELYEKDKNEYIRRKCYYNQFKKGSIVKFYARKDNVFLWLKEVYYNNNELYFLFRLDNEETIDYDIKLLRTSIGTNYKKSSSNQKTPFPPDIRYKVPTRIEGNTSNHFFLVFDKFTLDKNKDLVVQLDEINGNRNITLKIDRSKVNRPRRF